MSKAASRYRLYKMLLEMNLTSRQRESLLNEAGLFDKLKGALGKLLGDPKAAADLPKAVAGDKDFAVAVQDIKGPFKEGVKELSDIAKEHGVDPKELINYVIGNLLEELNVEPKDVVNPPAPSGGEGKGEGGGEAPAPGKTISAKEPEAAAAALQQAVADATGAKPEAVAEKADDIDKATDLMGKLIAKTAKVDAGKATLVIKGLIELGKLKMEGRRTRKGDIILATRMLRESAAIQDRWARLSGLHRLDEASKKDIEQNEAYIDFVKNLSKDSLVGDVGALKKQFGKAAQRANDAKQVEEKLVKINDAEAALRAVALWKEMGVDIDISKVPAYAEMSKKEPEKVEKAAEKLKIEPPAVTGEDGKKPSPEQKKAVAQAKENFSSSLSALSKKLGDKVTAGEIAAVLIALDDSGVIEVEKG